jgi:N-terminal domain of anti-restriction factor ArdC
MAKRKRGLSEAERAERRARDRERLQHAARELLTSDGWQRWVRARALFHDYSLRNCLLLAAQCHERGIDARRVAGFRTWLKLGRCVRKGEKGMVVLAPMPIKRREDNEERDEARVVFRSAFVFADSQTDPLPGVDPAPIEPPCEPLSGDSHRHLLERLQAFAREIDFEVALEPIRGGARGWCDPKRRRIVVDAGLPANAQVRVLVLWRRCRIPTVGMRCRA